MVASLAVDHNFDARIVAGLRRRQPDLDIALIHHAGLAAAPDPVVLEWAAREGLILLTHDRATLVGFDCFKLQGGRRIDKKGSCAVSIDGATITILNGGGIGTHITWSVEAQDGSGNVQQKACEVVTVKR